MSWPVERALIAIESPAAMSCRGNVAGSRNPAPKPQFAVLMCTHNGAQFVRQQLDSLVRQQLLPGAIVVHDWGSTDGTPGLLEQQIEPYRAGIRWSLTRHAETPGPTISFLRALLELLDSDVAFDHLMFCDQDDVWHGDKLSSFSQLLCEQPGLDLVYSDVELIDRAGQQICPAYLRPGGPFGRPMSIEHDSTMFVCTVSGMSMSVSRRLLERARTAWKRTDWVGHDWAVLIVAHLLGAPTAFIPRSLVSYRQHGSNVVGSVGRPGIGGRGGGLRHARDYVDRVYRQYRSCATEPVAEGAMSLAAAPSKAAVASCVLRGPSLPLRRRLKVAAGYALLWPSPSAAAP